MKILKRVLLVVGVIIGLLLIVSLFLPASFKVERTTTVQAPPDSVYKLLADFKEWNSWSPWLEKEPTMQFERSAETNKVGSFQKWKSQSQGNGEMTFSTLDPGKTVGYKLVFDESMQSDGQLALSPEGDATKVTWTMTGDAGMNPVARYFGLMMDGFVGPDFEKGLANIKKVAEKK